MILFNAIQMHSKYLDYVMQSSACVCSAENAQNIEILKTCPFIVRSFFYFSFNPQGVLPNISWRRQRFDWNRNVLSWRQNRRDRQKKSEKMSKKVGGWKKHNNSVKNIPNKRSPAWRRTHASIRMTFYSGFVYIKRHHSGIGYFNERWIEIYMFQRARQSI